MIRNPNPRKEHHGDCGARAISLALDRAYGLVWIELTALIQETTHRRVGSEWEPVKRTANGGVTTGVMTHYLQRHGWVRKTAPTGTVFKAANMPELCIAQQAGHYVLVRDGAVWDTFDSRGKRPKKLLGWWEPRQGGNFWTID